MLPCFVTCCQVRRAAAAAQALNTECSTASFLGRQPNHDTSFCPVMVNGFWAAGCGMKSLFSGELAV
jgi:hypothetical protein